VGKGHVWMAATGSSGTEGGVSFIIASWPHNILRKSLLQFIMLLYCPCAAATVCHVVVAFHPVCLDDDHYVIPAELTVPLQTL